MKYDSIAIMIKIASLEFDKISNKILAEYDLTHSQFKILKLLLNNRDKNIRQIDIENYFDMRNPTVTGLLQNLEKKNLIERIQNPEDSRSKVIRLTDKVFNMENELTTIGKTLEKQFTQRLDKKDKEQMKNLLKKMLGK